MRPSYLTHGITFRDTAYHIMYITYRITYRTYCIAYRIYYIACRTNYVTYRTFHLQNLNPTLGSRSVS